jgi:hypothetical protein
MLNFDGVEPPGDGRIFRGAFGRGIDITANGLQPNFNARTPVD